MLLKTRRWVVDKRLDLENHIRGTLKVFGFKLGKVTTVTFEARVHSLITTDPQLQTSLEPLLHVREQFLAKFHTLDKVVQKAVKADAVCHRLMTVPGVGPLTALLFRTTIDCPTRFAKSRDVGVHLGLTPRKYASGEVNYDGRITKCGDAMVRHHLYEAALVMLTRGDRWHPLKAWGGGSGETELNEECLCRRSQKASDPLTSPLGRWHNISVDDTRRQASLKMLNRKPISEHVHDGGYRVGRSMR